MRYPDSLIYVAWLIVALLVHTQHTSAQEPVRIKVTNPERYSSDFSEFIEEVSFLPLETRADCLMPGYSARVFYYKDLIFIHFGTKGGVYIYKTDGKFIKHLNPLGRGPNECISIYSIDIFEDKLYLFDRQGGKVLVLDFKGKPLQTIKLPLYPYDIAHNPEGILLTYQMKELFEDKPYEILAYDENKNEFFGYMASEYQRNAFGRDEFVFSYVNNQPFISLSGCDTIFNVSTPNAEPEYILDFGKYSLSEEEKKNFADWELRKLTRNIMALRGRWFQAAHIISSLYRTEKRSGNLFFYDIDKRKFYGGKWDYPGFELGRIYKPSGTTEDSFIFLIQAINIIEEAEEHPNRCSDALKAVAKNLHAEDNAVLMLWKVK